MPHGKPRTRRHSPLARRLRAALNARSWSQSDLARQTGDSRSYISLVLSGRITPSAERLARIVRVLGLSLDDLLDDCWPEVLAR